MTGCAALGNGGLPKDLVERARRLCDARGQRFTPMRAAVFQIVAGTRHPMGAYEIMDRLLAAGLEVAAPTVYRALDFLQRQQLIHRVESLNAFMPCTQPETHHDCQFLICTGCGTTAEIEASGVMSRLAHSARGLGFSISDAVVELKGMCASCRNALLALTDRAKRRPA